MGKEQEQRDLRGSQLGTIFKDSKSGKRFTRISNESDDLRNLDNSIDFVKTTITTNATKINFTESETEFILLHRDFDEILYLGKNNSVTTNTGFALYNDESLYVEFQKNNVNELYGIVASGSIDVYVMTTIRE